MTSSCFCILILINFTSIHSTDSRVVWLLRCGRNNHHYSDVIMGTMAHQITSPTIVYSTVYWNADQRKHQSSASLAFVRGIQRWPVNSPHTGPVARNIFLFDDVISWTIWVNEFHCLIKWFICDIIQIKQHHALYGLYGAMHAICPHYLYFKSGCLAYLRPKYALEFNTSPFIYSTPSYNMHVISLYLFFIILLLFWVDSVENVILQCCFNSTGAITVTS